MATSLKQAGTIAVEPLSPTVGVEIKGVDLSRELDPDTVRQIRQAWGQHSVLLFRGQDLSEDDQFRFAGYFGPVADRVKPLREVGRHRPDPTNRMQLVTDRLDDEGRPMGSLGHGEMWYHTDKCYVEKPHLASLLYALELPSSGGHTKFASLYEAHDRLSPELKARLHGRKVLQVYDYTKDTALDSSQSLDGVLNYWQPMFVANPDSDRVALYVCRLMTIAIEGLEKAESDALLEELSDLIEAPDNIYEHVWRLGDLIMWDNLSSVHARTDWPDGEPRSLRRCTIQGGRLS